MVAIPGFYEKPRPSARRFEVEDLASLNGRAYRKVKTPAYVEKKRVLVK